MEEKGQHYKRSKRAMFNQIKNLFNNSVSEYSMMAIVCCMLGNAVSLSFSKEWTASAVAFSLAGGIVLVSWLVWGCYVLISKKRLVEMRPRKRLIVETISYVLLLIWVYVVSESILILIPWALLFGWYEYRSFKECKEAICSNAE